MWTVFEHVLWYREKQLFTKSIIYKFDGKKYICQGYRL